MNNNIFQITNETQLNYIFTSTIYKLTLIIYSTKNCQKTKTFMSNIMNMANKNKNILFIYIDNTNYKNTKNNYFQKIMSMPTFLYYTKNIPLGMSCKCDEFEITNKLITYDINL